MAGGSASKRHLASHAPLLARSRVALCRSRVASPADAAPLGPFAQHGGPRAATRHSLMALARRCASGEAGRMRPPPNDAVAPAHTRVAAAPYGGPPQWRCSLVSLPECPPTPLSTVLDMAP
jgi:hypothetical protein